MQFPSFANPEFLYLAPLSVAVAWWWARRGRPAMRFSDASLFSGPRGRRAWLATWGGATLRGGACLALALACAGPRVPDERTRLPAEAVAIAAVVDVSGSMQDPVPWAIGQPPISRLEAAKRAMRLFVAGGEAPDGTKFEARPSDQVGLIELASIPTSVCPLTLNHSVLLKILDDLKPQEALKAGTNVGDAIALAIIRLDTAGGAKTKVIVLLSDGQHYKIYDNQHQPLEAAQYAANLGFKIYTLDAGGDPALIADAKSREQRAEGRKTLQEIAQLSDGRYFEATDGPGMLAAFKEIDTLEREKVETYQYRRYFEFYWWCAAAAVVLLLSAHLLDRTLWRVVP
jgi:Ca-activated chloride channel family protein